MTTRIRWLGHSAVAIETAGYHLLIDPFLTGNPKAAITADEAKADFILISHGHSDHVGDSVSIANRTGATVIANYEIAGWLEKQGVKKVHGQQHGGGFNYPFGRVKLTLAFHGSALPDGSNGGNPCGFLIYLNDGRKIYHAGDTGLFGDMRLIGEEGIELAMLPIGDNFTMGPDDAMRAVKLIEPKKVIPIHYDTWPIIAQDAKAWGVKVNAATGVEVIVLQPGEEIGI
jgi:L-ascorbate metabolism protein UlaG (beta-lactamase superfamily)